MSFIKRLGNLGKGMWAVGTGPGNPDEKDRIRALQEEMAAQKKRSAQQKRPGASASGAASTDPQARLDALADALREGTLTREQYDAACAKVISRMDRAAPPTEGPDLTRSPLPEDSAPEDSAPEGADDKDDRYDDDGAVKRTL